MTIFLVVLCIQILFFAAYSIFRRPMGIGAFLVLSQLTAQYLLVEFDLGPFSLRVYLCAALSVAALASSALFLRRWSEVPGLAPITGVWLAYLLWYLVASVFNGNLGQPLEFGVNFLSVYLLPTLVCLSMVALLRDHLEMEGVAIWLALIATANAAFAVLQSAGVSFAWNVHKLLFPIRNITTEDMRLQRGNWYIDGWPPGLSSYSIATSFVVLCFGVLWATYAAQCWHRRQYLRTLVCLLLLVLVEAGNVAAMSRSSIYLLPLGCLLALQLRDERGSKSATLLAVAAAMIAAVAFAYVSKKVIDLNVSQERTIALERIYDFDAGGRVDLIRESLAYAADNIIFGGAAEALKQGAIALTPHNTFINALLWAGAPGLILMLGFVFLLVYYMFILPRHQLSHSGPAGTLAHGLAVCLIMYLCKGMLHSDSFTTGGTIGWHLIGLWVVARHAALGVRR
jgi:hypothetical protein